MTHRGSVFLIQVWKKNQKCQQPEFKVFSGSIPIQQSLRITKNSSWEKSDGCFINIASENWMKDSSNP